MHAQNTLHSLELGMDLDFHLMPVCLVYGRMLACVHL